MTAAVLALFADGPCTIRNIASWRVKETDRLAAMATELRKVGARVEEGPDFLRSRPAVDARAGGDRHLRRSPHGDVLLARRARGRGGPDQRPECVAKTFPDYFEVFAGLVTA